MGETDFTLVSTFRTVPRSLFQAVATEAGIRGWWTAMTEFDGKVGSVATMRFPDAGFYARMKVLALEPAHRVHWKCIDAEHPPGVSSDPRDWVDTEIVFEINRVSDSKTRLTFTHAGLVPLECSGVCSNIWEFYINTSLRKLVEEGKGEPAEG